MPVEPSGNAVDQNTCHETAVSPHAVWDVPIRFAWMVPFGTRSTTPWSIRQPAWRATVRQGSRLWGRARGGGVVVLASERWASGRGRSEVTI